MKALSIIAAVILLALALWECRVPDIRRNKRERRK